VTPLPAGPFPVPLSTIDWLVSKERPAARYVALRDLLAPTLKSADVRKARQTLDRDPFVRDTLPVLKRKLAPSSVNELERSYDGALWLAHFLVDHGADASQPELKRAADIFFARYERTFVELSRHASLDAVLPHFFTACRLLARLGHGGDPRVLVAAEWLAERCGTHEGAAAVKDLLFFAALPEAKRSGEVRRAIAFQVERVVAELPQDRLLSAAGSFGFPNGEESDLLEALDALAAVGTPYRDELATPLALLAGKADHRARWKLDHLPAGERIPSGLERDGELSRWVTIRALRVLQRFVNLTVVTTK